MSNDTGIPSLDVMSNLSLACSPPFIPPTNEASTTKSYHPPDSMQPLTFKSSFMQSTSSTMDSSICCDGKYSWLPCSKGDIKKLAQTRFVNSSPNSYRLMPASVESSESDKTSFVEKSSHKFILPVSYFLEVAKLWALSNRSELECQFTLAKSFDANRNSSLTALTENLKKRPICHVKELVQRNVSTEFSTLDKTTAEDELLGSVNRFLKTCEKKDRTLVLNRGISDNVGSETRRYLSQIDSLMDRTFATKLKKSFTAKSPSKESRKRSLSCTVDEYQHKRTKESSRLNVFTVASSTCSTETNEDKFVIIHIPTLQQNGDEVDTKLSIKTLSNSIEDSSFGQSSYKCFYCNLTFAEKMSSARHMLSHLTSNIQT